MCNHLKTEKNSFIPFLWSFIGSSVQKVACRIIICSFDDVFSPFRRNEKKIQGAVVFFASFHVCSATIYYLNTVFRSSDTVWLMFTDNLHILLIF